MSFDVEEGSLLWNNFTLKTTFNSVNCGRGTINYQLKIAMRDPITNDQFSFTMPGYSFSGRFTGGWTATGTYAFDHLQITIIPSPNPCYEYLTESGTWTASWVPPVP